MATSIIGVTVPANMIVRRIRRALQNPQEVLTATEREQARARQPKSDKHGEDHRAVGDRPRSPKPAGHQDLALSDAGHSRDVRPSRPPDAFAWDAAQINLPGGRTSLAMSYYPAESAGAAGVGSVDRSTSRTRSRTCRSAGIPYPWPAAINIAGPASGMEYPGIVFDGIDGQETSRCSGSPRTKSGTAGSR